MALPKTIPNKEEAVSWAAKKQMKAMRIEEIAVAVGAELPASAGDGVIRAVCTDSRAIQPGCLFIALKGERFDGHAYIRQALEQGAAWAVAMDDGDYPNDRVLRVKDTRQALLDVAGIYRRSLDVKVVGVTGSVGKTTTKEMTACALSAKYPTLKNEANLNNEIGLSHTALRIEEHHRAAVLEMGMDGPGQIAPLSRCARPDVGIVTNIGVSHLEAMGSRENIRAEKLSIADGMADGAALVLCGDNDMLRGYTSDRLQVLFYGIDNPNCFVRAKNIREFPTHTTFELLYDGMRLDVQIPCMGRHNVYNALAAFCAAVALDVPPQDAIAALAGYRPAGMRQNIVKHNAYTIVEDCYNASPDSMRAALTTLGKLECDGRRIAVLSDMLELGGVEQQAHTEAGRLAAQCGIDGLYCTGELSRRTAQAAKEAGLAQTEWFGDHDALFAHLSHELKPGDTVWFKASRAMRLEDVIKRIYEEL